MTTADALIDEVLSDLLSGSRESYNQLSVPLATDTTAVELAFPSAAVQAGADLEVGSELMHVWDWDANARIAQVQRGWRGFAPATHAPGELVTVNPRFPRAQMFREINREVGSLNGEGLYWMDTVDLSASSTAYTYAINVNDAQAVYDVQWDPVGPENFWPSVPGWSLNRNQLSSEFPSGFSLRVNDLFDPGRPMRVLVKRSFVPFATPTADLTTTHVPDGMSDILSFGTQLRLMSVREARRTFTESQGDSKRASEAPVGSASRSAGVLLQLRTMRVREERLRLTRDYPPRKTV